MLTYVFMSLEKNVHDICETVNIGLLEEKAWGEFWRQRLWALFLHTCVTGLLQGTEIPCCLKGKSNRIF